MPHINHARGETRRSVNREVVCSCSMCGNPRRKGWGDPRTFQELLAPLPTLEEPVTRQYKKGRKGPKRFTIEKRQVDRAGRPGKWWTELKAYRTERDRDHALAALRKSVYCYAIRLYQRNDEGIYTGPQYEFQVGPTK